MTTIPQPAPAPADHSVTTLAQQIQDFVSGVLTRDPQQALLRGGLSFLVLLGAAIIIWGLHVILKLDVLPCCFICYRDDHPLQRLTNAMALFLANAQH